MIETVLQDLARAGAPSVVAPPDLAERVLARRRRRRMTAASALALGALAAGGAVAARSDGGRFVEAYQPSAAMGPTIRAGERAVADREPAPARGDVVLLRFDGLRVARRVIGLPGDVVACPPGATGRCEAWTRNGAVLREPYVVPDGAAWPSTEVAPGGLFVLGDDRGAAVDSRLRAFVLDHVTGVVVEVRGPSGRRAVPGAPAHDRPREDVDVDLEVPPAQVAD